MQTPPYLYLELGSRQQGFVYSYHCPRTLSRYISAYFSYIIKYAVTKLFLAGITIRGIEDETINLPFCFIWYYSICTLAVIGNLFINPELSPVSELLSMMPLSNILPISSSSLFPRLFWNGTTVILIFFFSFFQISEKPLSNMFFFYFTVTRSGHLAYTGWSD